jgi:hypothetical protein
MIKPTLTQLIRIVLPSVYSLCSSMPADTSDDSVVKQVVHECKERLLRQQQAATNHFKRETSPAQDERDGLSMPYRVDSSGDEHTNPEDQLQLAHDEPVPACARDSNGSSACECDFSPQPQLDVRALPFKTAALRRRALYGPGLFQALHVAMHGHPHPGIAT